MMVKALQVIRFGVVVIMDMVILELRLITEVLDIRIKLVMIVPIAFLRYRVNLLMVTH